MTVFFAIWVEAGVQWPKITYLRLEYNLSRGFLLRLTTKVKAERQTRSSKL